MPPLDPWTPALFALLVLGAALLLRLRVGLVLTERTRRLRITVARTGAELDFTAGVLRPLLFGLDLGGINLAGGPAKTKGESARRERALRDVVAAAADSTSALWRFVRGLWRAITIDELTGDVEGGFADPAVTGEVYGGYITLIAVAPSVSERLRWQPSWEGAPWCGSLRLSLAVPLADLFWLALSLGVRLPWVQWIRVAIGDAKGAVHVQ